MPWVNQILWVPGVHAGSQMEALYRREHAWRCWCQLQMLATFVAATELARKNVLLEAEKDNLQYALMEVGEYD